MSANNFLLIDHDDMVLGLLKGTIISRDPSANIEIAKNKSDAYLRLQLHNYQNTFCDYEILAENEFELLNHIYSQQITDMRVIVTFYGDPSSITFGNFPTPQLILPKPVDQRNLDSILDQLLGGESTYVPDVIDLPEEVSQKIDALLKILLRNTNSRCIFICNPEGRIFIQTGETGNIAADTLTSLVSGCISTLEEIGHTFNDPTVINLAFREGAKSDLYAMNIGKRLMLIMIQDKSVISSKLGTVWFYARQAAIAIDQAIMTSNTASGKKNLLQIGENTNTILEELDKIVKK